MVAVAYGVTEPRVVGPAWLDEEHFDLAGKAPEGVADTQFPPMLEQLLKDRFGLATHMETKNMSVYHLIVAPGGVKMAVYPAVPKDPIQNVHGGIPMMRGTDTVAQLAATFARTLDTPVIDKTGLTDRYNYILMYAPLGPGESSPDSPAPDLFTAVQQQLGLKLQAAKDDVGVVIVDQMSRVPTEN
jgi:uncharacterized protein (TIGR03435 family)